MGFFDFLKKSAEPAAPAFPLVLAADAKGAVVPMEQIPDEVFAQGILGQCCGIDPTEGKVYAPIDGEITQAPDSGHALGIQGIGDVEVLIHVGVDTVEMKGDGFSPKVKVAIRSRRATCCWRWILPRSPLPATPLWSSPSSPTPTTLPVSRSLLPAASNPAQTSSRSANKPAYPWACLAVRPFFCYNRQ